MDKFFQILHTDSDKVEFNRFGIMASAILIQDIVAAIAILVIFQENLSFIGIAFAATAANVANAIAIAQQPIKRVLISSLVSVAVSILLLLYCFL